MASSCNIFTFIPNTSQLQTIVPKYQNLCRLPRKTKTHKKRFVVKQKNLPIVWRIERHLITINHHLANPFGSSPVILMVDCRLSHSKDDIERFHRKQFWVIIVTGYLLFNPTFLLRSNITTSEKFRVYNTPCIRRRTP